MKKYILIAALALAPFVSQAINITVPSAPGANYGLKSTTTGAYVTCANNGALCYVVSDSSNTVIATLIPRLGTQSTLNSVIPLVGELVYATNTNNFYIGDGTNTVANLGIANALKKGVVGDSSDLTYYGPWRVAIGNEATSTVAENYALVIKQTDSGNGIYAYSDDNGSLSTQTAYGGYFISKGSSDEGQVTVGLKARGIEGQGDGSSVYGGFFTSDGTGLYAQGSTTFRAIFSDGDLEVNGALYDTAGSKGTNGQVLLSNGTNFGWVSTSTLGLGGGGGGSGTVNTGTTGQIPYYAANGTALTATSSVFLSSAGRLGIGTTTPTFKLDVDSGPNINGFQVTDSNAALFRLTKRGTLGGYLDYYNDGSGHFAAENTGTGDFYFSGGRIDFRDSADGVTYFGVRTDEQKIVSGDLDENNDGAVFTVDGGNSSVDFSTNAGVIFKALVNGNFGIGTSTPRSLLSVGNTNGINFNTATSTFNSTGGINLANGGCFASNGTCVRSSQWTTAGSNIYYNTGNVGIGVATPQYDLSFSDNDGGDIGTEGVNGQTGMTFSSLEDEEQITFIIRGNQAASFGTDNTLSINGGVFASSESHFSAGTYRDPVNGVYSALKISNTVQNIASSSPFTVANFGVASTNFNTYAGYFNNESVVSGSGKNYGIYVPVSTTTNYFAGSVGIGTAAPGSKLSVASSITGSTPDTVAQFSSAADYVGLAINATRASGLGQSNLFFQKNGVTSFQFGSDFAGNGTKDFFIYDQTNGAARLYINSSGNVGVGTTSPYAKLSVVGQTVSEYFTATSSTATSTFAAASTTNISVGGKFYDRLRAPGTNNQVLVSTGTGVQWVSTTTLGFGGGGGGGGDSIFEASGSDIYAVDRSQNSLFIGGNEGIGEYAGTLGIYDSANSDYYTLAATESLLTVDAPNVKFTGTVQMSDASKPTCDGTTRGTMVFTAAGTGNFDNIEICLKGDNELYYWITMREPGGM